MSKKTKIKRMKKIIDKLNQKKLYCMDCGEMIDPEIALNIEIYKNRLNMSNILVFCNGCQFKMKNRLRRIWNGIKYLFE